MRHKLALALIALSACQNAPPTTDNATTGQQQADAPFKDADAIPAEETAVGGEGDAAPAPNRVAIPTALRGRWGLVAADCTSTRGDAKGLLIVTTETLTFYEARARLERAASVEPNRITGRFAFTGEGQQWLRNVTLALQSGALLRSDEEITTPLRYARCA